MQIVIVPGRIEKVAVSVNREQDDSGWYVGVALRYVQGSRVLDVPTEWYHGLTLLEAQDLAATALDTYLG